MWVNHGVVVPTAVPDVRAVLVSAKQLDEVRYDTMLASCSITWYKDKMVKARKSDGICTGIHI